MFHLIMFPSLKFKFALTLKKMKPYIYPDGLESKHPITKKLTENHILPWADFFKDKEAIEYFPSFDDTDLERSKSPMERKFTRNSINCLGM